MKCDHHPEMDAISTCAYCGRGICEDCKIRVNDLLYCKECAATGRVKREPIVGKTVQGPIPPMHVPGPIPHPEPNPFDQPSMLYVLPEPKGTPTNFFFKWGAAWSLVCCSLSLTIGVLMLYSTVTFNLNWFSPIFFVLISTLSFTMLPLIASYLGFYRNYGTRDTYYAVVGGLILQSIGICCWLYLVYLDVTQKYLDTERINWLLNVSNFLLGLTLFFLAISIRNIGIYMPPLHPSRRGVFPTMMQMLLTSGLFMFLIGFYIIGWFFLGASMISLFLLFSKAPVPETKSTG